MDGHAQPANICDAHDGALWPKQPVQLARGRQPRDALAKTMAYYVSSMDAFETSLREYLESPPEQPEHTEAHVSFWIGTSFMVSAPLSKLNASPPQPQPHFVHQYAHPPPGFPAANVLPAQYGGMSHVYPASDPSTVLAQSIEPNDAGSHTASKKVQHKVSLSIMDALQPTAEPKEKMRKQRAIAKCCVESIQRIDGYRYSFHNCWNSREDDSFRFSYYCNDSLLNKDRAANGKGAKLGKRATKPVYDCKGVLSIKFSASKQTLDVFYKHIPVHKTYEERAPAPRKDSKRRRFLEAHDPDALARLASRPRQLSSEDPDTPKTKKNKSKPPTDAPRASNTSLESDLRAQSLRSLLELIQVDPPASVQSAPPEPPPPPPPPQPPSQYIAPAPRPLVLHVQVPPTPTQQRRRPRNSCDVCKAKKTKCDGTRPICKTCGDRKRKCFYSELTAGGEQCQSEVNEPARQAHAANNELSELAKMKRELEEAKARIQELETEKRASSTPIQTPQMSSRPLSRPLSQPQAQLQPQRRPQISQAHTQSHIAQQQQQQPQRQQAPSNHRQQLQQLNQVPQRGLGSPQQQLAYKLDTQSPQQRLQPPQLLNTQQQLQAAAAQQMQPSQHAQLQPPQNYFTAAAHANHAAYGPMTRPMTQNGQPANTMATQPMVAQNIMSSQSNAQLPQTQPQQPTAPTVDANNPYGRGDFGWTPAAYYGYQSAQQQQQQQDQWAARGSGVFR